MKVSRALVFACAAFLFVLISTPSSAQTWEQLFVKVESRFAKGQYAKVKKDLAKLKKKGIPKKFMNDSTLHPWLGVMQVRANLAQKEYRRTSALAGEVLQELEGIKTTNPINYQMGMIRMVDTYNSYGNYRMADSIMTILKQDFYYYADDLLPNEILARDAYTRMKNGFYKEADSLIQIVKVNWPNLYQKSYNGEIISKLDVTYRQNLMAMILMTEIEIMSLEGRYDEALALHQSSVKQINKLTTPKSQMDFRYKALEVALYKNFGDYKKAKKQNDKLIALKPVGPMLEQTLLTQLDILYHLKDDDVRVSDIEGLGKSLTKSYNKAKVNADYIKAINNYILAHVLSRKGNQSFAVSKLSDLQYAPNRHIPVDHQVKQKILETGIDFAMKGTPEEQVAGESYYLELNKTIQARYAPNSIWANLFEIELAGYYLNYSEKPTQAYRLLEHKPYQMVVDQLHYLHHALPKVYDNIEEYLVINADFDYGIKFSKQLIKAMEANPNTPDSKLGEQYADLAGMQVKGGYYRDAELNTDKALKLIRKGGDKVSAEFVFALSDAAAMYGTMGLFDKAEKLLNKSQSISKKLKDHRVQLETVEELAFLLTRLGNYKETEDLLYEVIEEKEALYGPESRHMIQPYNALGNMHLIKGEYTEADRFLRSSVKIAEEVYGEESLLYAENLTQQVDLYIQLGNYESGLINADKILEIREAALRPDHILLSKTYLQLGILYYQLGADYGKVHRYFEESRDVVEANFDQSHPLYAEAIKNIAFLDVQYENLDTALVLLDKADEIWADKLGSKNKSSGEVARLKGDIYSYRQEFKQARNEYEKSARYFRKIFSETHPDYLSTRSKLARSYFIADEHDKVEKILDETTVAYLDYTDQYFPTLSEEEKSKFWYKIKPDFEFYNTLAVTKSSENSDFIENMFDYSLITKGLLLNSSIKTRQTIMNSGDSSLIQLFEKWTELKEFLAVTAGRTQEDLESEGIDLQDIKEEVASLEKQLGEKSDAFADGMKAREITWKEVRKSLEDNEAAVEIIRYREFDTEFNEEKIRYAALVVSKETKKYPRLIVLENGNELEQKYFRAQRYSVKYKLDDKTSFTQFWQPIQEAIGDKDIVYLSPDGIYNQLNVESLKMPDGRFIIDDYNVRVVNSTKTLVTSRSRAAKKERKRRDKEGLTAMLFGNPDYYKKKEDQIFVADTATRAIQVDFVPQLPGTEKEINEVSELLETNGWEIESYMGDNATEASIKDMEDATLIHIATHGFFDDNPEAPKNKFGVINEDNPMDRSGLLTTGGGDLLKKSHGNYNMEDGILTAHEAMTLNFDKVELVVLSACETGRGEIKQGEGVFGLQRSFLVAGADAIIMSLFTVSDEVTQMLMVEFYKNWLNGDEKRIAFNKAQQTIKESHPDPIFWGAFMMVSNN